MARISCVLTSHLSLTPATPNDAWELWEIWKDPAVCERLFERTSLPAAEAAAILNALAGDDLGLWVVRSRLTSRAVGCVSLAGLPKVRPAPAGEGWSAARQAELVVAMSPPYWGRGWGTEAARAMLHHAFTSVGLNSATAHCQANNQRALRLLKRLGFTARAVSLNTRNRFVEHEVIAAAFLLRSAAAPREGNEAARAPVAQTHQPVDWVETMPMHLD